MTTITTSNATERRLGPVSQIPPGEGRAFDLGGGRRVAVFRNRQGALFATQAECPHRRGPLADGLLGDSTVVCPLHDWRFDLTTGRPTSGGEDGCAIATYPVRAGEDGQIVLTLDGA